MTQMLSILGSTGSSGTQSLDVIRHFPGHFLVYGLGGGSSFRPLAAQIREFRPRLVAIHEEEERDALVSFLRAVNIDVPEIIPGAEALEALCSSSQVSTVVVGVVGLIGL